jgi:hypothetical protein
VTWEHGSSKRSDVFDTTTWLNAKESDTSMRSVGMEAGLSRGPPKYRVTSATH